MKYSSFVQLLCFVFLLAGLSITAFARELPDQISDTECSLEIPCPEGLACINFPDIGLRCAEPNACKYYPCPEGTKCVELEIYPLQIQCASLDLTETPEGERVVSSETETDEDVQAQDLGVSEPRLLPDSPFYFAKNWWRGLRLGLTFNPIRRVELREKFSNEKLLELKKLAQRKKDPRILKKAIDNYQKESERIEKQAEALKARIKDKQKLENFLDKFTRHQILHQKILERLEDQTPREVFTKIKEVREKHLERFKNVMLKLEDKNKIPERLERAFGKIRGSKYKTFKHLEILKKLEEKASNGNKKAFQKAEQRMLQKFKARMEKMPPKEQERFQKYLERIRGDKEKHLEILEDLRSAVRPDLREKLEVGKVRVLKRIKEKAKQRDCPDWTPPAPGFCKKGRVVVRRDENGCPLPPQCIVSGGKEIKCETSIFCKPGTIPHDTGKLDSQGCPIKRCVPVKGEKESPVACIQVITPAISPEGICKQFPTPCDVPKNWKKVVRCPEKTFIAPQPETQPAIGQCLARCRLMGGRIIGQTRCALGNRIYRCEELFE